ncbi:hypothetical protein FS935_21945 [Metabacillus litoralis]|uniref:Uncharacterized protein n=1 Tax=Metabacillus litoralis TaxID=152268 RepID=A0A5C6V8Y1_9BACI|nr:hypothetical protein [Metabacillus litoralis]TXC81569.1 hypothetical protein FS935_21945 [Metabacillus litoralis]
MKDTIKALLFDFSKENLDVDIDDKFNITLGNNILNDILRFEKGNFIDNPFVQLTEIECELDSHNFVSNEKMSNILGIDKSSICFYQIYTHFFRRMYLSTIGKSPATFQVKFIILAYKEMFEKAEPIFDIRFKSYVDDEEKWSSWQAIAGKFIVAQEYRFGPGGIAEVYNSMTEKEIENFKQNFQIRYSGSIVSELGMPNTLPRIINDPFSSDLIKIIDPNTFQILFDSQILRGSSSEESGELWQIFDERYR